MCKGNAYTLRLQAMLMPYAYAFLQHLQSMLTCYAYVLRLIPILTPYPTLKCYTNAEMQMQ